MKTSCPLPFVLLIASLTAAPICALGQSLPVGGAAANPVAVVASKAPGQPRTAIAPQPNQLVPALSGQIVGPLPHAVTPALQRQIVRPLPGQMVRSLPGQIVRPLPGQIVEPLPGQIVRG